MKKVIIIAALLLAATFTLQAQEVKEQDPAAHKARVFPIPVEHLYFHSEILGVDKNFSVLLPRSYAKEPERRYPVVYMLHGAGENDWEWANIPVMMISEAITMITNDGSATECIIVFPNANEAGHMGYFNQEGWKYEDYFFQERCRWLTSATGPFPTRVTGPSAACRWAAVARSTTECVTPSFSPASMPSARP